MLNRIGFGAPFLFDYKFFTLVRVTLLTITVRPGRKTPPLTLSISAHTGATIIEPSTYLKRAGVEPRENDLLVN